MWDLLLDPVLVQDSRQARQVGGVWVTFPEKGKKKKVIHLRSMSSRSAASVHSHQKTQKTQNAKHKTRLKASDLSQAASKH